MNKVRLTVGMSTYDDFWGVWPTVQALRLYHKDVPNLEIIVVDNNPNGPHAEPTRNLCAQTGTRYIPYTAAVGTSAPRDLVFREAKGDAVVCVDPHILLAPGSLSRLVKFYENNPNTMDLYQGPMLYDNGQLVTHFTCVWGAEMWGQWATAWECKCHLFRFDVSGGSTGNQQIALYRDIFATEQAAFVKRCPKCNAEFPNLLYSGHESHLVASGYLQSTDNGDRLSQPRPESTYITTLPPSYPGALTPHDPPPFEIPAQGLGLFSCRKEAWLGFNPDFRGFGGEEWYIHLKYRKAGHKAICLPFLQWMHRFGRPGGPTYPLTAWNKARNYVLGFRELGMDPTPIRVNFPNLKDNEWTAILEGKESPAQQSCGSCGTPNRLQPPSDASLDQMFDWAKSTPRDLNEHADAIKEIASQANNIIAFVKRREWNVLLMAGRPQSLTVYQTEADPLLDSLRAAVKAEKTDQPCTYSSVVGAGADSLIVEPQDCDLLVIDTVMTADRLMAELMRHGLHANRILVRGTGTFGEQAEFVQGPGLLPAIRRFVKEHPEYTVIKSAKHQYGWSLLSRRQQDKKKLPSLWQQGVNAAKASWRARTNVIGNFGILKDTPAQEARLALCLLCDQHTDGACSQCGCPVDNKTSFPTEFCPLGIWHQEETK